MAKCGTEHRQYGRENAAWGGGACSAVGWGILFFAPSGRGRNAALFEQVFRVRRRFLFTWGGKMWFHSSSPQEGHFPGPPRFQTGRISHPSGPAGCTSHDDRSCYLLVISVIWWAKIAGFEGPGGARDRANSLGPETRHWARPP